MIQAICDGFANEALKIKFNAAEARIKELKRLIDESEEAPPVLHPSMAERYRREVGQLVKALNDKPHRAEASSLIRDLVDLIVLTPNAERSELMIDLHGDLAGILKVANGEKQKAAPKGGKSKDQLDAEALEGVVIWAKSKMVAGAGNTRFCDWLNGPSRA
jgi:site-specific DNA recombinase